MFCFDQMVMFNFLKQILNIYLLHEASQGAGAQSVTVKSKAFICETNMHIHFKLRLKCIHKRIIPIRLSTLEARLVQANEQKKY